MASPSRSGAFEENVDASVEKFTESVSFDYRLSAVDIAGSIAHTLMLARQEIISPDEAAKIVQELNSILKEIESGEFEFKPEFEDVHMNIEKVLVDRLGDTGRKLHTGRSRNDQVSTDQRMWVRDQIDQIEKQLVELQRSLVGFAERELDTIIPAYTHMQRAQPVLAAHYFLAFCEKFERDRQRLLDCRKRANQSSLGTAALAGTSLPIDREFVAEQLEFDSIVRNSLDSSSDRDYVIEFVFCLSLISIHLSTMSEDWIIWSTTEFDFIDIPQKYCTGSSIMPQKVNPDVLELIRGKTARVIGSLQTLLVLVKGLPMAYNRDLQEDKPPLFDSVETVTHCVALMTDLVSGAKLNKQTIANEIEEGYLDATTLMEFLIKLSMPQRKAHHLIGEIVKFAMENRKRLADLTIEEFKSFDSSFDDSVFDALGVKNAVSAFVSVGSTALDKVTAEIGRWRASFDDA